MIARTLVVAALVLVLVGCVPAAPDSVLERVERFPTQVDLPAPTEVGSLSLEEVLTARRSGREFNPEPLPLDLLGQLFWAAQGVTDSAGHRTAPSAGARYPLDMYAITSTEVMHYLPEDHRVETGPSRDQRGELGAAAFGQSWIAAAPAVFIITGTVSRSEAEYGAVAGKLMEREAGHAAQNFLLEATALDLAAVPVGGFDPAIVADMLALAPGEEVLYLLPVGGTP